MQYDLNSLVVSEENMLEIMMAAQYEQPLLQGKMPSMMFCTYLI